MSDHGHNIGSPEVRSHSSVSSPPRHGSSHYHPSPSSNPATPRILSNHPLALLGGILPITSGHSVHQQPSSVSHHSSSSSPATPHTPQSYYHHQPAGSSQDNRSDGSPSPMHLSLSHQNNSLEEESSIGQQRNSVTPPNTPGSAGGAGPHQGPQPISPPPPAPQISAAELSLLTEASATKNGTFQCTLCSKQFGYKNGLIRHVRLTHVGEKPYQCTICNRRFGYKHILMEHQNLHFGNRPYACVQCDKRFAARSNLIQHRMVHKRPFNCSLCSKRFDREDQLKKHLFAHPQSLFACGACKFTGASQVDINRHVMEEHGGQIDSIRFIKELTSPEYGTGEEDDEEDISRCDGGEGGEGGRGGRGGRGGGGGKEDGLRHTESNNSPDSSEEHQQSLGPSRHGSIDSRGHRIDAICSQLSTSVASGHSFFPPSQDQPSGFHGIVIKKELVEEGSERYEHKNGGGGDDGGHEHQSPRLSSTSEHPSGDHYPMIPSNSALASAYGQFGWPGPGGLPWGFPHHSQSSPSTGAGGGGGGGIGIPTNFSVNLLAASNKTSGSVFSDDAKQACSASMLPGIHEVFSQSRRSSTTATSSHSRSSRSPGTAAVGSAPNQKLPSFANFMPVHQVKHPLPDLSSMLHSPPIVGSASSSVPQASFQSSSSSNTSLNPVGGGNSTNATNPTQRPTAQLPPIAHTMRQTKDRAGVQHSITIAGFPSLDDVLSYYVSQGRLFKCAHCNILFFERGMYFLHASLHGLSSPWECSICHKVCADKNEFTLHFVNQQHNNS